MGKHFFWEGMKQRVGGPALPGCFRGRFQNGASQERSSRVLWRSQYATDRDRELETAVNGRGNPKSNQPPPVRACGQGNCRNETLRLGIEQWACVEDALLGRAQNQCSLKLITNTECQA